MASASKQLSVPLSHLVPGRRNPRKVKPARKAHHRLVALIRSHGLLQPLVVRPAEGKGQRFEVVAGQRRLEALREIHKGDGNPKIPCVLQDVDVSTADAMSLGENFGREPMHPLDEAEAFAKLAGEDGKDAQVIAAEFGVKEHYVRQRMKLATLATPIKSAYRQSEIDTATAEAFAAVPADRQLSVWKEVNGHPQHPEHVRNIIANAWIDSQLAQFDIATLPESAVSRDMFGDRTLIERQAFMEAQVKALDGQRQAMGEEGWHEVVVARREDVQDRLFAMENPEREFDEPTNRKLASISQRKEKLEKASEKIDDNDEKRLQRIQRRYDALETQEQQLIEKAPVVFSEEAKAVGTAFLILDPDGKVHREVRVPRPERRSSSRGKDHSDGGSTGNGKPKPPTSDDLGDKQLSATFTHEALAVREALLSNTKARKRILAMILHEKVRSEALAVRHEPNGVTLHADGEGFNSLAFNRLREQRSKLDPLTDQPFVEDLAAYESIGKLSDAKLDAVIDLLIVDCITAHPLRQTELIRQLAIELRINVRDQWRPDAQWLSGYQKFQLAHLITQLMGAVHAPAPERKKSELVDQLAKFFTDAAEGKLEDKQLAERVNRWLPSNLRQEDQDKQKRKSKKY